MTDSDSKRRARVAVDAMGGDHAPGEVVKGAVQAARDLGVDITLVGIRAAVEKELQDTDASGLPVRLVEATQRIEDGEQPALAVMRKPNSSVAIAARLVKQGEVDAMVSDGSTGATMVAALTQIGTLPGIERPVIGGAFLQLAPDCVVIDLGANVGCQPYQFVNFAAIGTVYVRSFLGVEDPTVGLLNVGSEEGKGNDQAKEAYALLRNSGLNFIGNVEGMDIARSKANVIICDGFVGNILVKFSEGLGASVREWLTAELSGSLLPSQVEDVTGRLFRLISPGEVTGGGPMWGVDGVACIAHGASRAPQIMNTIEQARLAVESGFVDRLKAELERVQKATQK